MKKVPAGAKRIELSEAFFLNREASSVARIFQSFLEAVFDVFCALEGAFGKHFRSISGDLGPSGNSVFVYIKPQVATFGPSYARVFVRT